MQKNAKVIDADASCFCFWIFWPPLMVLLLLCSVFGAVVPTWPSNGSKMHGPHTALHHEDQKHHLLTRPMYQSASAANPSKFGWHGTKVPWYSIETFVFSLRGCYCENLPQHVPVPWLNPPIQFNIFNPFRIFDNHIGDLRWSLVIFVFFQFFQLLFTPGSERNVYKMDLQDYWWFVWIQNASLCSMCSIMAGRPPWAKARTT